MSVFIAKAADIHHLLYANTDHITLHVLSQVSQLELVDLALLLRAPLSLLCFASAFGLVVAHDSDGRHLAMHHSNIVANASQPVVSASHAAQECHRDLMKDGAMVQRNVYAPLAHHRNSAHK
jgi:hypothetical protein